ncbi:MAG: LytR C-terminal domain-containing protein [Patescibacteria group bacterium]
MQQWQSNVRVLNPNQFPITVYAEAVNFAPQGEGGTGKFIPIFETFTEGTTLAEWIEITQEPITVEPESSISVPFSVTVPDDASPGGHFAAILIGTQPPEQEEAVQIRTAQVVSSLFFVRIDGDVVEDGTIRSFRALDQFTDEPTSTFELRFENKGNVHLQPQGDIRIINMWGEERGVIPVNHETHFGNVLPDSVRRFSFSWEGERSFTDIGRFRAEATLAYGTDQRKFVTRSAVFWVIPVQEVILTLLGLYLIFWIVRRMIRAYIRRMLYLSGIDPDISRPGRLVSAQDETHPDDVRIATYKQVSAPIRSGYLDFITRIGKTHNSKEMLASVMKFVVVYRMFFASLLLLVVIIIGILWYLTEATVPERSYTVTIENDGTENTKLSSEDIIYDRLYEETDEVVNLREDIATSSSPTISIINVSGVPGAAAIVKRQLEERGYLVGSTDVDLSRESDSTVVVFSLPDQDTAVALSQLLDGALLSARAGSSTEEGVTVFVGGDNAF